MVPGSVFREQRKESMKEEARRERVQVRSDGTTSKVYNENGLPTALQDVTDIVRLANTYLYLVRCPKCKRFRNRGYVCIHCGNAD